MYIWYMVDLWHVYIWYMVDLWHVYVCIYTCIIIYNNNNNNNNSKNKNNNINIYIYIYIYIYMYVFLYESGWIEPSGSKSLYFVFFACGIWMYANGISFHPGRSIVIRKWKLACWTAKDNRWAPPAPDTDGLLLSKQLDIAGHFDKVQFQI